MGSSAGEDDVIFSYSTLRLIRLYNTNRYALSQPLDLLAVSLGHSFAITV